MPTHRLVWLVTVVVGAAADEMHPQQPFPPAAPHHRALLPTVDAADAFVDGCYDVNIFGANPDGITDNTAAFQAAVNAANPTGGCVRVPPVPLGKGYVLTGTVTLGVGVSLIGTPAGMPTVPWCYGAPGDVNTTGSARIFARPAANTYNQETGAGMPLFVVRSGCTVRGLLIMYDRMPFPTDAEFTDTASPWIFKSKVKA